MEAIYGVTFIAIRNRSIFCYYKMRWGYYRSGQFYYKSVQILQIAAQNTSIVVGSFLSKLKSVTINFERNIFCNILKDNVLIHSIINTVLLILKIYSKTYVVEFPLEKTASLQSTTYYRTKNFITHYFSWSARKLL